MAASSKVRIAVGQLCSGTSAEANLRSCTRLARQAAKAEAKMLFLPECFNFLGTKKIKATPETLTGPTLQRYKQLAAENKLWLSLGGIPIKDDGEGKAAKAANTHIVITAEGELLAAYKKIHLFDLELPGLVLKESESTAAGETPVIVQGSPLGGGLGLSVCYDLRFPALYSSYAQHGAIALAIPAAFTVPTGQAHWELLLRARAVETQCFVIAAAQSGKNNLERESWGHSIVVDPWGRVILDLGRTDKGLRESSKEEGKREGAAAGDRSAAVEGSAVDMDEDADDGAVLGVVDLDLEELQRVRSRMPVLQHSRPQVYSREPVIVGAAEKAEKAESKGGAGGAAGAASSAAESEAGKDSAAMAVAGGEAASMG